MKYLQKSTHWLRPTGAHGLLLAAGVFCLGVSSVLGASPLDLPAGYAAGTLAMPVSFVNNTQGEQDTSNIWINLVGGGLPTDPANSATVSSTASIGYYYDNTSTAQYLYTNTSINLSDLQSSQIYLYGWGSGRLYISYGAGFTGLSDTYTPMTGPYAGWQPAPTEAGLDPNFQIRHQAVELTVTPEANSTQTAWTDVNQMYADLSYIDYTAISLGVTVSNPNSSIKNPTQTTAIGSELIAAVSSTNTSAPQYTPNSNVLTVGTNTDGSPIVQVAGQSTDPAPPAAGSYQNAVNFPTATTPVPGSNFLRVASPGSMGTTGSASGPTAFYHDWSSYMTALQTGGSLNTAGTLVTTISGTYGGTTAYNLTATFNAGNVTLGTTEYTGYVAITGTIGGVETTIYIPYSEMEKSTGVYGENPMYSINGQALQSAGNTVETWVVGDLLTGMNFGFVGSETLTTPEGSTTIGSLSSSDWWSFATANPDLLFEGAQSNPDFYNTYAAALQDVTTGYGFAYEDRLGQNTTNYTFTPGSAPDQLTSVLNIMINPDFAAVPEPSTIVLLGLGGIAAMVFYRRRMRA